MLKYVRARVLVAVEASSDTKLSANMKLCVKYIRIVDDRHFEPEVLVFEWFNMAGQTPEIARRNCVEAIAYYVQRRPDLREAILGALDMTCALEVAAIGVTT